jgi:hypothetical protein
MKFGSFTLYRSENLSKLDVHTTIFLKIKVFVVIGKWKIVTVYEYKGCIVSELNNYSTPFILKIKLCILNVIKV